MWMVYGVIIETGDTEMPFTIKIGLNGKRHAVFKNSDDAWEFRNWFLGCIICSFGQYENAYELSN